MTLGAHSGMLGHSASGASSPFPEVVGRRRDCTQVYFSWARASFLLVGELHVLMVQETPGADDAYQQLVPPFRPAAGKMPMHSP